MTKAMLHELHLFQWMQILLILSPCIQFDVDKYQVSREPFDTLTKKRHFFNTVSELIHW